MCVMLCKRTGEWDCEWGRTRVQWVPTFWENGVEACLASKMVVHWGSHSTLEMWVWFKLQADISQVGSSLMLRRAVCVLKEPGESRLFRVAYMCALGETLRSLNWIFLSPSLSLFSFELAGLSNHGVLTGRLSFMKALILRYSHMMIVLHIIGYQGALQVKTSRKKIHNKG